MGDRFEIGGHDDAYHSAPFRKSCFGHRDYGGGLANPFASLLVLPLALSTLALSRRWVVATALAGVLAYAAVATFDRDLPHMHGGATAGFNLHLWGMAVNFVLSAGVVLYFSTRLVAALRMREQELARMHRNFYGFDPSYHVARHHFVHKLPHAWTPRHLAVHREVAARVRVVQHHMFVGLGNVQNLVAVVWVGMHA